MISHRLFAVFLIAAFSLPAATAWADDDEMVFGVDEVEEDYDDEEEEDDDDTMMFAPDDLDDSEFDPEAEREESVDVGVIAVPGEALSDDERRRLQTALDDAASEITEINVYSDSGMLDEMNERDPEYCAREALCLASLGRSAGVERILQARVEEVDGRYRLDLDYFDVDDRLFVSYHSSSDHRNIDDIAEAVPGGVNHIFGIRSRDDDDEFVDDTDVNVPRILAFGSAGLGAVFLGAGTYFGLQVNSLEEELAAEPRTDEGQFENLTQRQARDFQREMEANALYANLFIGVGSALAVTSVLLFVFGPDGADADDASQAALNDQPWYRDVDVAPNISGDGLGFGARWRF